MEVGANPNEVNEDGKFPCNYTDEGTEAHAVLLAAIQQWAAAAAEDVDHPSAYSDADNEEVEPDD